MMFRANSVPPSKWGCRTMVRPMVAVDKHVKYTRHNPFWRVAGWFVQTLWCWFFCIFSPIFWAFLGCFWVFLLPLTHFWCFQRGWVGGGGGEGG